MILLMLTILSFFTSTVTLVGGLCSTFDVRKGVERGPETSAQHDDGLIPRSCAYSAVLGRGCPRIHELMVAIYTYHQHSCMDSSLQIKFDSCILGHFLECFKGI